MATKKIKAKNQEGTKSELESSPAIEVPQYARDVFPRNSVLSAADLHDFSELVLKINESALKLEIANINKDSPKEQDELRDNIINLMQVEYSYTANNGNSVQGLGLPNNDKLFPNSVVHQFEISFFLYVFGRPGLGAAASTISAIHSRS